MTFDLLIEPEQLAAGCDEPALLVVDLCGADSYRAGHIPGAVAIEPQQLVAGTLPAPGKLPSREHLEELFSLIGLTPQRHVVAYNGEGSGWAARLLWTLACVGHHHYSLLNGGLPAWKADGCPLTTEPTVPLPSHYRIGEFDTGVIASAEEILANLGTDGFAIWDARSHAEYIGTKSASKRAGHIPGAHHLDWLDLMDHEHKCRLRPAAELAALLQERGLTPKQNIITHCQSHHRSALAWFVAKWLGYPQVKGYDGSWAEWSSRDDTPIETG